MMSSNQGEFTRIRPEPVPGSSYQWQVVAESRRTGETVILSRHGSRDDAYRGARYQRAANR